MNEVQEVQFNLLKEFARVMDGAGFKWFAMFGTLLGAYRCGGFIPEDDDIDVVMTRGEYDRLRQSPDLFKAPYFLQTTTNDPAAAPRFLRLINCETALIPEDFPNYFTPGGHMGIYIDIIPLDVVPDTIVARRIQGFAAWNHKRMFASAALDESGFGDAPPSKDERCRKDGGIRGFYGYFAETYEKSCSVYPDGYYYAMPVLHGERGWRVYDREWFEKTEEMDFEGLKIPVPIGWRECLVTAYPEGLRKPDPRFNKPEPKHVFLTVDTHRSYKEYTRRYTDMLIGIEDKKVYIFGAGDSLRIWLERYGEGLDVAYAFDNSAEKWGSCAYGVTIRKPAELPGMMRKPGVRMIIASIYHKEIGKQLEKMGITDYYVFIDGWSYRNKE